MSVLPKEVDTGPALAISRPTMNFNVNDRTLEEFVYSILHEFGHSLRIVREHPSPASSILWDQEKMYDYYRTHHNRDCEAADSDMLRWYDGTNMKFSEFNPDSIVMSEVPGSVTKDGSSTCEQNC